MTRDTEPWTTQALELYHDEELDDTRRAELSEALRRDPALRERLASVRGVDETLRDALLDENPAEPLPLVRALCRSRPALAAACVLIAVTAAWALFPGRGPVERIEVAQTGDVQQPGPGARREYQGIRVLFSLPVQTPLRATPVETARQVDEKAPTHERIATTFDASGFLSRVDRLLDSGQVEGTLDLLAGASEGQRAVAYRHMGELLRSAYVAEQILDRLSPREQVAVCSEWAGEPGLRPIVFDRLRRFSKVPELSDHVQVVVARLAEDGTLRSWLRGYQLVGPRPPGEDTAS